MAENKQGQTPCFWSTRNMRSDLLHRARLLAVQLGTTATVEGIVNDALALGLPVLEQRAQLAQRKAATK